MGKTGDSKGSSTKSKAGATGKVNTAVVKKSVLRILLFDRKEAAYAEKEYELTVGGAKFTGKTPKSGLISHPLVTGGNGELLLKLPPLAGKKPAAAAAKAKSPPPYPPPIVETHFQDEPKPLDQEKDPFSVRWTLSVLSLTAFDTDKTASAQDRLSNLGFRVDGERGAPGLKTEAAVKAFQRLYKLAETGKLADATKDLSTKHDSP